MTTTAEPVDIESYAFGPNAYAREIIDAAESVGAWVVELGQGSRSGTGRVMLEWRGAYATRITLEHMFPAAIIRRLPNLNA